jgi:hypothetical protein
MKKIVMFFIICSFLITCHSIKQDNNDQDFILEDYLKNSDYQLKNLFYYDIELFDGICQETISHQNQKITVTVKLSDYYVMGYLNDDYIKDIALLLYVEFSDDRDPQYYLSAKISNMTGFVGTNSFLLHEGNMFVDRFVIQDNLIEIDYFKHANKLLKRKKADYYVEKEFKFIKNKIIENKEKLDNW